jgi:hypothetical protein
LCYQVQKINVFKINILAFFKVNAFNPSQTRVWEDSQVPGPAHSLVLGLLSFDLTFRTYKFTSPRISKCVIEHYGFVNLPKQCGAISPFRRAREWTRLRTCHLPNIYSPGSDQPKSRTTPVGTSLIFVQSERGKRCWVEPLPDFLHYIIETDVKKSFLTLCMKYKKIWKMFCRNRYLKNWVHQFSLNLMSKSERSTLTSPGTIRVKIQCSQFIKKSTLSIVFLLIFKKD